MSTLCSFSFTQQNFTIEENLFSSIVFVRQSTSLPYVFDFECIFSRYFLHNESIQIAS